MLSRFQTFLQNITSASQHFYFQYQTEYGPYLKNDPVTTSESFYKYIVSKAGKYITKDSVVLDTGCGLGRIAIDLANKGALKVIGTETNTTIVHEAGVIAKNHKSNIVSYPCQGNVSFIFADVAHLPFENETFSLALCINVIDRIKHPQKAVDQLYRVLQKKGILLLCNPYDWMDITPKQNRVNNMKELLDKKLWDIVFEEDNIPYNIYIHSRRTTHYQNHLLIARKK